MLCSPLSKATRSALPPLISLQRRRPQAPTRQSHHYAVAANPVDFFTSTVPGTSQRTKPVGFDEEPCALGLRDGYGYASIDIGHRLGPNAEYEVLRKLGWGMYATTWLVLDSK